MDRLPLLGLALVITACARPAPPPVSPSVSPSASPGAGPAVDFSYGFRPGSAYAVRTDLELGVSASSEDPDAGPTLALLGPLRQSVRLDLRHSFAPEPEGAELTMTTVVEDVQLETAVDGTARALPGGLLDGFRGLTVDATLDRKGRRAAAEVSGGVPAVREMASLGERLAPSLPTLPDGPLRIGDSFTSETEARLPAAGVLDQDAPVTVAATYTLRDVSGSRALFDVATALRPAVAEEPAPFRIRGEGGGRATFDLEAGYFAEVSLRQLVTLDTEGPPALTVELELGISTTTEPLPLAGGG